MSYADAFAKGILTVDDMLRLQCAEFANDGALVLTDRAYERCYMYDWTEPEAA